jgi:beta-lactamase regulating signal transducer with metallopeptidase domain
MIPDYMLPFANHLWQSTLFVIAVWAIALMLRQNRAAMRHRLWLAASVKFLVPFSLLTGIGSHFQWQTGTLTPPHPVSMIVETISQPFSVSIPSVAPPATTPARQASRVPAVLIGVWLCGIAASLLWWFIRWRQVRRAVRLAVPSNLDGPLRVMYGPARFEPGVFGIFRPVLLLPEDIARRLSPAQLQAVLAHELCHARRRDNLAMAIHMSVEALFWFHPLVWFIKARLIEEQERACDEEVLRLGSDPKVYAESILKICEYYVTSPLICVAGIAGSNLKKRIKDIMRNRVALRLSLGRALLLACAAISTLAGPIIIGIGNVKAGEVQSQSAVRSVASPIGIGEERPLTGQTAQLQGAAPAIRPTATQTSTRESARTSTVLQEYRLGEIKVTGNKILSADFIQSLLKLDLGNVFNESRLRWNMNQLRERYASLGYVRFEAESVPDFDEQQKVVNLTVNIDEGSQYIVGEIKVTEAKILSADLIRSSLGLVSGEVYNESRLRQGFKELKTLYGNLGYVHFIPLPVQDFDEYQKVVNLTVNLDEGSQYTVNRISFTGNTTTPDEVMRRELLLREGAVFNASLLTLSLSRLSQLGLFEEIKFEDVRVTADPSEPKVDIDLRVREKAR